MTGLDARLTQATDELRADVAHIDPPPFEPTSRMAPVLAAAVLVLAVGIFAVFAMFGGDDRAAETIVTEPGVEQVDDTSIDEQLEGGDDSADEAIDDQPAELDPAIGQPEVADPTTESAPVLPVAGQPQAIGPVSAMASGSTATPVDGVGAWNADESMMLLYRRGESGSPFVVIDASTGADIAALDISPADIEQVYWSPTEPSVLYYPDKETPNLMEYDLTVGEQSTLHSFDGCGEVTAGGSPVRPSLQGDFGLVCTGDDGRAEFVAYNANSQREVRRPATSTAAPRPSPSGSYFVAWNDDGSASVLDSNLDDTGVILELGDNEFVFVVDADGQEAVAAALYGGQAVGTVVVLPLATGIPRVVIGPDAGDEYPPGGTRLSAAGSSTRLVVSVAGPATTDSALAGRLLFVDLAAPTGSEVTVLGSHGSTGQIEHWSSAFVSISPSGQFVATSSDNGSDAVNTTVLRLPD